MLEERSEMSPGRFWLRSFLAFVGLLAGLLLVEAVLYAVAPYGEFGSARELPHFRRTLETVDRYVVDPAFGFRPRLDTDLYGQHGTRLNAYSIRKNSEVARVLFIGDSVTARGVIVRALESLYGASFEYRNAGVESFNTVQEVAYYKKYNAAVRPDHVVLTFHVNDFESTPVVFLDYRGRMVVYAPNMSAVHVRPWLFRYSRLYRLLLGNFRSRNEDIDAVMAETFNALADLQKILERDGIRFSVLLLPYLKPTSTWSAADSLTYRSALEMFRELDLRHFDLLPVVKGAMALGVSPSATPGDTWHPGPEMARYIAENLHARGLLAPPPEG